MDLLEATEVVVCRAQSRLMLLSQVQTGAPALPSRGRVADGLWVQGRERFRQSFAVKEACGRNIAWRMGGTLQFRRYSHETMWSILHDHKYWLSEWRMDDWGWEASENRKMIQMVRRRDSQGSGDTEWDTGSGRRSTWRSRGRWQGQALWGCGEHWRPG